MLEACLQGTHAYFDVTIKTKQILNTYKVLLVVHTEYIYYLVKC